MSTPAIAAPVSAPAPAASSPAPAPVTTPTPAPSPTPTPAPVTSEPQSMEDKLGAAWKAVRESTSTAEPVTEAVTPSPEEPATPATEPEAVAETETAAEPAEPATPEFELSLDDGDPASPEALFKELKADPAAAKFFEDRPELKNKVMAALRRDTENREIRKFIPDVETAKQVTAAASTFQQIDNRFLAATTPEGAQEFLNHWVKEAMFTGDDGKPLRDAEGRYQMHPALEYTFDHIFSNKLSVLEAQAQKSGDERLQAAVEIIKGLSSPSPSAVEDVPENLKPYADSLKAERAALDKEKADGVRQRQETAKATHQQSIVRAESKAADNIKAQLKPSFAKAGLTDFESEAALQKIGNAVDAKLEADGLYQSLYDSILLQAPSEAREKALTKHMLTYTNIYLGTILAETLRAAKGGALNRQTDKQTTVEGQKKASQTDPRGTSTAAVAPQQRTSNAAIEKEYTDAHNGEKPSLEWVLGEAFKRNKMVRPA